VALGVSLLGCAIPPAITPQPTQGASPRAVPPPHAQVLWSSIDFHRGWPACTCTSGGSVAEDLTY